LKTGNAGITKLGETMAEIKSHEWLTDKFLTNEGALARKEYENYCKYLDSLGLPSYQIARAKYFLQKQNYWTLPDGFALPPHTLNVCVNNICNLGCRYCDFGQKNEETFYHQYNVVDRNKKIELPIELCYSIIDQSKWYRPIIRASFREPMLYKPILDLINYTKKNEMPFWLLTNGINLTKYAKELVELDVDSVRISLDGPEEVHDKVRGAKGAFNKTIAGVKLLLEEMERKGSKLNLGFYFTINDFNYSSIYDLIKVLDSEKILDKVYINFQWLLFTTEKMAREHNEKDAKICGGYIEESTIQSIDFDAINFKELSSQAERIKKEYPFEKGYKIHFRPSFDYEDLLKYSSTDDFPVENPRCRTPWYNMNINPAGDVKCFHHCLLPDSGNVHKENVMDIWNGDVIRDQRIKLKQYGAYRGCARCWGIYALLEDKKRK
jgi:MoaA/NifB/PqqE/SkfB family radical SAM enzyme